MGKSPKTREEISVGKKQKKTNVMRILDQKKIPYTAKEYPHEEGVAVDGMTVAKSLGQEPGSVFKTLVTRGASGEYYVFDIPVAAELDLKKAAKAVGEKHVAMLHVAELLPLTGYVRRGSRGHEEALFHYLPRKRHPVRCHRRLCWEDRRAGHPVPPSPL